ncbi:MAG: hypothetical protein D6741_19970 [Planctomycetota bacterium]|nr:MAG: hypothetical protein D6741_19970 [Planctomycetota bacterium]
MTQIRAPSLPGTGFGRHRRLNGWDRQVASREESRRTREQSAFSTDASGCANDRHLFGAAMFSEHVPFSAGCVFG